MTAPLRVGIWISFVSRRARDSEEEGGWVGEGEGVHWETEGHLELVARGTTAPGRSELALVEGGSRPSGYAYPLLDILRDCG